MRQLYQLLVATGNHGGKRLPSGFDDKGHDPQKNWRDGQVIAAFPDADFRSGKITWGSKDLIYHAVVYALLTAAEADLLMESADGKGKRVRRIDWQKVVISPEILARMISNKEDDSVPPPALSKQEVTDLEAGQTNTKVTPLKITDAETLDYSKLKAVPRG